MMRKLNLAFGLVAIAMLISASRGAEPTISPQGQKLAKALDAMDVENLWLPGKVIDFDTGKAKSDAKGGNKVTHCSAFVAVACGRFEVPMLRPPEHASKLLANAQASWLAKEGEKKGWTPVKDGVHAQQLANEGKLVVAAYREEDPEKPGHIAIVRPGEKSEMKIKEEGPQVIQAGGTNANSTPLKVGFRHHKAAFPDGVKYYVHELELK